MNRRDFLRLAGLVAAGASVSACAPIANRLAGAPAALPMVGGLSKPGANRHFAALNRLTYGPRIEERRRAAEIGLGGWIEEQLAYEGVVDTSAEVRLRPYDAIHLRADELDSWDRVDAIREFKQATLLRRIYSYRQLYEVMVEFWTDHFNISIAKDGVWTLKIVDDREVIRPHALGNFRDLLLKSAHSPAMLVYLDNHVNHKDAPNENYAREVMELHTLGVDGGYSQDDVMELARCLTGWTVKEHFWPGEYEFDQEAHSPGEKTVLGQPIALSGEDEAVQILERLADHPSSARYLSTKLVRRFITDDPQRDAPELVARAAETFEQTKGDLRAVLRTILLDGLVTGSADLNHANAALSPRPKFKRPVHFLTSALRLTNAETTAPESLHRLLATMGQPDYEWPTPDGPADVSAAWMNNLLPRWKFALAIARGEIEQVKINMLADSANLSTGEMLDHLAILLLGAPFPAQQREHLFDTLSTAGKTDVGPVLLAGLLASPAFQWR